MESAQDLKIVYWDHEPDWSTGLRPGPLRASAAYEPGRRPALRFTESLFQKELRTAHEQRSRRREEADSGRLCFVRLVTSAAAMPRFIDNDEFMVDFDGSAASLFGWTHHTAVRVTSESMCRMVGLLESPQPSQRLTQIKPGWFVMASGVPASSRQSAADSSERSEWGLHRCCSSPWARATRSRPWRDSMKSPTLRSRQARFHLCLIRSEWFVEGDLVIGQAGDFAVLDGGVHFRGEIDRVADRAQSCLLR